ncbi:MAG: hypothetical protein EBY16_04750 [Gammaproteobacteria bacterium]|nr:hypothetical protein [Gammaproteobacteria bacterium]
MIMHTSIEPNGCYLYSNATLKQAQVYLELLCQYPDIAGKYLQEQLNSVELLEINAQQLIVCLMNTRKPLIFAESQPVLNGSDWNEQETSILGGVSFSTTGTHSYNNGAWGGKSHVNHLLPIHTNFIFVAGALLRNDKGTCTADMAEVLSAEKINEEAFYRLYERRLLPGLLMQNQQAKNDDVRLVINIPGIGCGQFAGTYQTQVRAALPRVLKKLFTNHAHSLDRVDTVNFDPFVKPERDEFFAGSDESPGIRLMQRPSQRLFAGQKGTIASQLEFPKDGSDYSTGFRLLKIVAWDHFSFPGNDIWGDKRYTDDGASFASSDVILAMLNAGQFDTGHSIKEVEYDF